MENNWWKYDMAFILSIYYDTLDTFVSMNEKYSAFKISPICNVREVGADVKECFIA